jgi:hypothetical protein
MFVTCLLQVIRRVSQGCRKGVARVSRGCREGVTRMLQEGYKSVTSVLAIPLICKP